MSIEPECRARWITRDLPGLTFQSEVMPAPCLRREFDCPAVFRKALVRIAAPGYCDLRLDGGRIDRSELAPTVSVFDRRVRFLEIDVTGRLVPGKRSAWSAVLGNGWYNCHTHEVWHFDKAPWRDYPKFRFELEIDGELFLASNRSWRIATGGLLFDGLRNGETYDARLEPSGWRLPGFDDSGWERAVITAPPGGILTRQTAPCCQVMRRLEPVRLDRTGNRITADFGENLTGWCRITVRAPAGTVFTIRYYERLAPDGQPEQPHAERLAQYILDGEFQTDHYTAAGVPEGESWRPRFTYHGFRYAVIELSDPAAELCAVEAQFVCSAFERTGEYRTSDENFNRLTECAVRSYLGNFTGIPTDCPQREKNGWTGDALLAAETGLFLFDAASSYSEWLETLCDSQRPSGQLPAIAPTGGWGFNGCSGPAWDSVLVLLPWSIYLHTGDRRVPEKFFPAMLRYLNYCREREEADGLLDFGLADWCAPNCIEGRVERCFSSSAYYIRDLETAAAIAGLFGEAETGRTLQQRAAAVRTALLRRFRHSAGEWGNGGMTELGMALEMDLVPEHERFQAAAALAELARQVSCQAQFGIQGARYVPRALARNGHIDTAWRFFTQHSYPGWMHWLDSGATTLLENWEGSQSWNHIMYGDFVAFAFEYLGGIRLTPGFAAGGPLRVAPCIPAELDSFQARCRTGRGEVECRWRRHGGRLEFELTLPAAVEAELTLCDRQFRQGPGKQRYTVSQAD